MPTVLEEQVAASVLPAPDLDEPLYEVINGLRVEMPPMSAYSSKIASRLVRWAGAFADPLGLGEVVGEVLFRLPLNPDRNRRPDMAFVSAGRWPLNRPMPLRDNAWDVVPDLAAEVVSPNDLAEEIIQKLLEYFQAGVRLVWVVYPQQQLVYVHESPTQVRGLTRQDELDGGAVLPGFRLPLANLFTDVPGGA